MVYTYIFCIHSQVLWFSLANKRSSLFLQKYFPLYAASSKSRIYQHPFSLPQGGSPHANGVICPENYLLGGSDPIVNTMEVSSLLEDSIV